jgi:hypothetical protein
MNKVVVVIVGAIVGIVGAIAAGVILPNHLHTSSQPNVPYNTLYFLNSTEFGFNYLIVLNETTYSQIMQLTHNNINVMYIKSKESVPPPYPELYLEKIIPSGNYVLMIVGTPYIVANNVGSPYYLLIPTDDGYYTIQLTYKGNWIGPLP